MTIQQLIAGLQQMVETGGFEPEDELVVTWWSHEDVALTLDQEDMPAEKMRDLWAKVATRFDHNIDSVIEEGNNILFDYLKEVAE